MTPRQPRTTRLLQTAAATAIVMLLAQPAAAQAVAATPDDAVIACMATLHSWSNERLDDGALQLRGTFKTFCDGHQKKFTFAEDPEPPAIQVSVSAAVMYCSQAGLCTPWASSPGAVTVEPEDPPTSGSWVDTAFDACALVVPFCNDHIQHWQYYHTLSTGGVCAAGCEARGLVLYQSTHLISIPAGEGYRLSPASEWMDPKGSCVSEGEYALRCQTFYTEEVKAYQPLPSPLPPSLKELCEDVFGKPVCNP